MAMLRHPLSGSEYFFDENDGPVRVVGKNGAEGQFSREGVWIAGERRTADPALARWMADAPLIRGGVIWQIRENHTEPNADESD